MSLWRRNGPASANRPRRRSIPSAASPSGASIESHSITSRKRTPRGIRDRDCALPPRHRSRLQRVPIQRRHREDACYAQRKRAAATIQATTRPPRSSPPPISPRPTSHDVNSANWRVGDEAPPRARHVALMSHRSSAADVWIRTPFACLAAASSRMCLSIPNLPSAIDPAACLPRQFSFRAPLIALTRRLAATLQGASVSQSPAFR